MKSLAMELKKPCSHGLLKSKSKTFYKLLFSFFFFYVLCPQLIYGQDQFRVEEFQTEPSTFITDLTYGIEIKRSIKYRVIFPSEYDDCPLPKRCFAVVYFLHGRNGDAKVLEHLGIQEIFKDFKREGIRVPFLIVLPEGQNNYWMNAADEVAGKARWASFVSQQLVSDVESRFSVLTNADSRVLAGLSMGGHGALQIGMNHPGIFSFLAAHSPVLRAADDLDGFEKQFGQGREYEKRDPISLLLERYQDGHYFFRRLWLDIGSRDHFINRTQVLIDLLKKNYSPSVMKIDQSIPAGHENQYWKSRLREYLFWYKSVLESSELQRHAYRANF